MKIHALYKLTITLSGNIDPTGVIAHGTSELVGQKTKELLEAYADSPRLIINAGCAIPPDAPEVNIRKLIDVTRNYF